MKLLITGATGYIGTRVVQLARKRRHEVVVASRRRPAGSSSAWMPYELASDAPIELPSGTKVIIHLATNIESAGDEREVLSARLLIASAQKSKAKLVFVSSQVARVDAPTAYGRIKWQIEQEILVAGGWVVRPGQVYGGCEKGLFGKLAGAVRRLPIIPAFLPAPKIQPIHVNDLAEGLLRIIERDDIAPGVLCLASPQSVSFTQFMLAIASARVRGLRLCVPIPVIFIQLADWMLGTQLRIRLGLARLNSLLQLPVMNTTNDLQKLGLVLRPFLSGMHPSGDDRRRRLISEAKTLLTYVLKTRPDTLLLRRYVCAIEKLRQGIPLALPAWALRMPVTLAMLDNRAFILSAQATEFAWRLDAATVLAESTIQGSRRFLGLGQRTGPLMSLVLMTRALMAEVFWRVMRIISSPFIQRYRRDGGNQA